MLEAMTDEWLRLLGEVGWETPTEDLTWCTTEKDDVNMAININAKLTRRTEAKSGFKVLGTMVTFDNNFDVEVENRLARATRAFWASWEMLGCASVPLPRRLQIFRATVEASVCWCAGSWNLRAEQLQRIRGAQSRRIRKCYE